MRCRALILVVAVVLLAGCGGGGKKKDGKFPPGTLPQANAIQALNFSPSTVNTGTVVEISATYNNPAAFASVQKQWEVSAGVLSEDSPDFDLVLREVAGVSSGASTLSTTSSTVYWFTPATPGNYRVSLRAGNSFFETRVAVTASPIYLEVTPGTGGTTLVRVMGRDVSNLYQGAFRVLFNAALYQPTEVRPGTLLGGAEEVLFLGLTNQSGFVPIGITRKGDVPGVSGSGVIAEVVFTPRSAAASRAPRQLYLAGFELALYLLCDNRGEPLFSG